MGAGIPSRSDRFERVARGMLAIALLAGVAWALAQGGIAPGSGLGSLLG